MVSETDINGRGKVILRSYGDHAELTLKNGGDCVIDVEVIQDLITAFSLLDRESKFIILDSGGGDFSFGFDTSCVKVKEERFMREIQDLAFALRRMIESVDRPVFALVEGFCLGLGFEICLACDHIYCSKSAKFGFPDSMFGLPPLTGIYERISSEYGKSVSDLFLTGEILNSTDLRVGLFSTVISDPNWHDLIISQIESYDSELIAYYKNSRKLNSGNPDLHLFRVLDPERIRLKELEAFRNNL